MEIKIQAVSSADQIADQFKQVLSREVIQIMNHYSEMVIFTEKGNLRTTGDTSQTIDFFVCSWKKELQDENEMRTVELYLQ